MKVISMPPVHAANLVANSGNTTYGVDVIVFHIEFEELHKADKSIVEHCGICINLSVFISQ